MIQLIRNVPRPLEHPVLRRMFAARKAVFVDLLGWEVTVVDGRFEVDQFDDGDARYLVVTDAAGAHRASARLLPTTRPHLLGTLFPGLCADAPPTGPAIFEITRFCLDRSLDARARRTARDALVVALVDHGLTHGIARYTAMAGLGWARQILAFGWRSRPLGPAKAIGGEQVMALEIAIEADTRAKLAATGIIGAEVTVAVAA
ncbi:acyl-homoserine-lactone synthase [Sphingomonas parapaucimobilis]|uniref:Acyl-homoserine-lactone synthase n=1 Tax=Sphingomonas parapaucimobilis NBRC 15100 TaxID=1219049 RepID=A0A0A1W622_9SPHN|nr:acyl-homoserine-lactone synthase [Sphingomonas parapaucimobilis]GAM00324.1 putative N-acyl-L-homoserine lactone synthase [Sphingomonas parapaucimobilis NBRC 15100]